MVSETKDRIYWAKVVAAYVIKKLGGQWTPKWKERIEELMPSVGKSFYGYSPEIARISGKPGEWQTNYDLRSYLKYVKAWLAQEKLSPEVREKLVDVIEKEPYLVTLFTLAQWKPEDVDSLLKTVGLD